MTASHATFERRVVSLLEAEPPQVSIVLGGCGTGRTSLLGHLKVRLETAAQYMDVERTATTPERFFRALVSSSPFSAPEVLDRPIGTPRGGFDATLAFFDQARTPAGGPATFLLDEFLELRTFESFPGLRTVLADLTTRLAMSPNRFVLTSRYIARATRIVPADSARFVVLHLPPLTMDEVRYMLTRLATEGPAQAASSGSRGVLSDPDSEYLTCAVHALSDGRAVYARAMAETLMAGHEHGAGDPVSALASLMAPGGKLHARCEYSYELRLHRARGYGALKAILEILSDEEPQTLTEISHRLGRTPGSTKDYLSWLEDVDLVTVQRKRYSFNDPILRLWVRLHCRPSPPSDQDLAREVHAFSHARLPHPEPTMVLAGAAHGSSGADDRKPWGIIEID
ncbi:MAG: helix-turn-helix transcriptional regulator [Acidobacteria bacterium]|nr:helix-turn-helix transcriptional regulator [Acidobacteriota bacterium]